MTDFYCDHQNTTLYPSAYMSTPASAASLPQDGDGTVTGTGATPAVSSASWDCTSASASSGTMTIMGATVTGITGGAGATVALAAAAAINASTAAVTTANGNIVNVYLKALVWATTSGATLIVYSRIASAALNYSSNSSCLMAAGTGWISPPANAQFSGGVSGPFAYLFNTATLAAAVSSTVGTTVGGYGAMPATVMGAVNDGDRFYFRSKRSGANIEIILPTNSSITVTTRSKGTRTAPLSFLVDSGVKWPGDNGVFTITADSSLSYSRTIQIPAVVGLRQVWAGSRIDDDNCSFRFKITGVPIGAYQLAIGGGTSGADSTIDLEGIEISGDILVGSLYTMNNVNSTFNYVTLRAPTSTLTRDEARLNVRDCVFRQRGKRSVFAGSSGSYQSSVRVEKCKFDHTGITQTTDSAIVYTQTSSFTMRFEAINCRWIGFTADVNLSGFQLFSAAETAMFSLKNCFAPYIGVAGGTTMGGLLGITESAGSVKHELLRSISVLSALGTRNFVFETVRKSVVWVDSSAPYVTASRLPDDTPFSLRYGITSESGMVTPRFPVRFPRLGKHNSLADGTRTAKLKFLADNNILAALSGGPRSPTNEEIWAVISYVKTDGTLSQVSSGKTLWASAVSVDSGVAGDWSATSYDLAGAHSYTPFEITLSLPNVKTLTELGLELFVGCQSNSVTNVLFVSPEWSLT